LAGIVIFIIALYKNSNANQLPINAGKFSLPIK